MPHHIYALKLPVALALLSAGIAAAPADQMRIRVIDSQGGAISHATVSVQCRGNVRTSATADSFGEAAFPCTPAAEVTVSAPGFQTLRTALKDSNEGRVQNIALSPAMVHNSVDVIVSDSSAIPVASQDALTIERTGARTVFDAVEKLVPGAFVTHRGVLGYGISSNGTGQISIRGVGESPNASVLIVVDGRPDFQGEMGHPLPDFFSLTDAGRVSVTEGPASVLYGSNAMGGVVEIDPIQPSRRNETRLSASIGSFLTGQYRLSNGGELGRFYYEVTGGLSHTNGDREYSHFREGDASVLLGYELTSQWRARLDGRYGHFLVEDPGPVGDPSEANYAAVGRGGFSAALSDSYSHMYGSVRVYGSRGRNFISDGFRSIDDVTGVHLDQTFALRPTLLLEVGTDVNHYGGEAHQQPGPVSYGTHHVDEQAGFALLQWAPFRRLRLNTGYRYQANSQFGDLSIPEAGGSFALSDRYSVAFKASRGFRNPTLRELYLFPAPNPDLLPETMWNYESSFHARLPHALRAWTTVYYANLDDLIVTLGHWPNMRLANSGNAINRGVEVNAEWSPLRRIRLQGGYAAIRSTNLAPYVPENKLNYSFELPLRRWTAHFSGISAGRRSTATTHTSYLTSYTNVTLRLSHPLGEHATAFALVDNLLNRRHEFIPGYPMPGTNAAGGFTLSF